MFCAQCGTKSDDGARFCSKCGNSLLPPPAQDVPSAATPQENMPVVSQPSEARASVISRIVVRSAILGGLSPVVQEDYWLGFLTQAISGAIVGVILYGLEMVLRRGTEPSKNLYAVAGYRGALVVFLLSIVKYGDVYRAFGSMVMGALFAAVLYAIESGILKVFRKEPKT